MTDEHLSFDGSITDAATLARLRLSPAKGPILPIPEVILLLDSEGRIVEFSDIYSGERLGSIEWTRGSSAHDVMHSGCSDGDCHFMEDWAEAWAAHAAGLPVEWLFVSHVTGMTSQLRLQPVGYACGILFGDAVHCYEDHSVLFVRDVSAVANTPGAAAPSGNDIRVQRAAVYQLRRSTDPDPNLVASLDDRLRTVTGRLLVSQEEERKRIASELHDSLGQTLSLLRYEIESCIDSLGADEDGSNCSALRRIYEHTRRASDELREIARNLRPTVMNDLGLAGSLELLCSDFRAAVTGVLLTVDVPGDLSAVPDDIAVAVYRISQEALNNIVRHANASRVSLEFAVDADGIFLEIRDDGDGMPEDGRLRRGLGLVTMRERAEALGGTYSITSEPRQGSTITVSWPASARSLG